MSTRQEYLLGLNDNSSIDDLDLSVRAYNRMYAEGCRTLGDVKKFFDRAIAREKFYNLSKKTIECIDDTLEEIDKAKEEVIKKTNLA